MKEFFGNIYKGKKVLITGDTGFKGSWLTLWLLEMEADVYGIADKVPTTPSMFDELGIEKLIKHQYVDIRDYTAVKKVVDDLKPDFIFHLAAQAIVSESYSDPLATITTNVIGTANILESVRDVDFTCSVIVITSDKCYNNVEWEWGYKETDAIGGKDIYSGSKGAAESIFYSYFHSFFKNSPNIRLASVRAGNVIGGGDWAKDRLIPDCVKAWNIDKTVEIRSPESTRPWQHVLEPLSGYLTVGWMLSQKAELSGESFNFGPAAQINKTVLDVIKDLYSYFDQSATEPYKITDNLSFDEAKLLKLNCDKALFYLKWKAVLTYSELMEFTGDWYAKFYSGDVDMFDYTIKQIRRYGELSQKESLIWSQ